MSGLRRHALVAVGSNWIIQVVADVARLITMAVLARLLLPEEYGTYSLAFSIGSWLTTVGFLNFAPVLLRGRGTPTEISTLVTFGLGLHMLLTTVGVLAAFVLWIVWGQTSVATLLCLMLLALPMQVPAWIETLLLQREFQWTTLRVTQVAVTLCAALVSIALAAAGAGAYALATAILVEPAVFALRFVACRRPLGLRIDRRVLAEAVRFGWPMAGAHALWSGSSFVGTWAVGVVLGTEPLGLLNRALALAGLVFAKISGQASYPLLPVLARAHDDAARRLRAGRLVLRASIWAQLAVVGPAWLLAEPAIRIVYGERWLAIVPLMPWALALALVNAVIVVLEPMVMASGRTDLRLRWELSRFAGTVLTVGLLFYGLEAYLAAQAMLLSLVAMQAGCYAAREGWLDRSAVRDVTVSAVSMAVAVTVSLTVAWHGETWIHLVAAAFVYTLAYVASLRLAAERDLSELVEALPFAGMLKTVLLLPAGAAPSSHRSKA